MHCASYVHTTTSAFIKSACLHGFFLLRRHGGEVGVGGHDHKVLEREEHVREAVAEHLKETNHY